MFEKPNSIHESVASTYGCPMSGRGHCIGVNCMAWVREVDQDGSLNYYGRCGMAIAIIPPLLTYTPTITEKEEIPNREELYSATRLPSHNEPVMLRDGPKCPWFISFFEHYEVGEVAPWRDALGRHWTQCAKLNYNLYKESWEKRDVAKN